MNTHLTKRRVVYGVLTTGMLLLFAFSVLKPEEIAVEKAAASWQPLEVTVNEDGRTRSADSWLVVAPVAGQLQRLTMREGARIRAGDVVARIQPPPQDVATRAQLETDLEASRAHARSLQAVLVHARSAREQAELERARRVTLRAAGALSAEQMEQYDLAVKAAQEAESAARENLRAANAQTAAALARVNALHSPAQSVVPVRATVAGTVMRIPERSARMVAAGEPLLEIGSTETLEVVVDVLSGDAVRIRPGQTALLSNWGGEPVTARVRRVEPAAFTRVSALGVEEQRVNVILGFEDCPATMGAGYRVDAAIVVWSTPRTLVAPASAFFRNGQEWAAFVIEKGRARIRTVQLGERTSEQVQVLSGLADGEDLILFPGDDIADGTRVEAIATSNRR